MFYGAALAAQHSDRPYPLFMNVPGLKILCPTTPSDVKGLLKSAIRDDDPVILFEDTKLWPLKEEVSTDPEHLIPIGKAVVRRAGHDVTVVALGGAMRPALDAATELVKQNISAEVIDLRSLKPLDMATIMTSVAKTGRVVLVENAHRMVSATSEIAAAICEEAFDSLKRPIIRLTAPDVHVPFSPPLEATVFPTKDKIVSAVKRLV
jgi:pyruvate dehydrogenase E1 component beta subunit